MSLWVRSEYSYCKCQWVTQQGKGLNVYLPVPGNSENIQVTHLDRFETSPHLQWKKGRDITWTLSFLSPFFLLLPHLAFFLTTPPFLPSASTCSTLTSPFFFREGDWRPLSLLKKKTLSILPTKYFPLSSHPYFFSWEKGSRTFLYPRAELGAEEPAGKYMGRDSLICEFRENVRATYKLCTGPFSTLKWKKNGESLSCKS